jgi:hypothetical protein
MTEAHQIDLEDKILQGGRCGRPDILNGPQTLIETGQSMPESDSNARKVQQQMKEAAGKYAING